MQLKASLAAASAAPLLMLGATALAQPQDVPPGGAPYAAPNPDEEQDRDQAAGMTLTCHLDRGPRAGASFEFTGTVDHPAQVGAACSDMSGSTGVAIAPEIAGQPGQNAWRRSQGRYYYQGPGYTYGPGPNYEGTSPNSQGPTTNRSTWTCRFTSGPRSGSSVDFARVPGSNAMPVGSGCSDGSGSTGVAVPPGHSQYEQQEEGPY